MSVKVAVRVRPFNSREVELNSQLCVAMSGQTTTLLDLEDPKRNRDFTFDYSFWSHDQFITDENGFNIPENSKYADQRLVFNTVGKEILDNAWEGYHCCLFAYGQTGAGKSYSMVGYGANKGIVPISCEEIFKRIHNNPDPNKGYEVQVSMIEIYNEKVQDLLIPVTKRPAGGLKVREHKMYGVYVEGLTKHAVDSYAAIEAKMEDGNRNRTVASTQMNASSSRAHTIIQIEFKQITTMDGKKTEKLSVINLVDLAGSEKVGKTGATGDRLKEAGQINKSLTILGLVISTLADKAMGKGKNIVVPYRDSSLTRILQNALGGNSKTLMICAISPATDNYEETLSTLRYADQAKKIKNNAVVNESETDKMIRELKVENEKLKQTLMMLQKSIMGGNIDKSMIEELNSIQDNLEANEYLMEENSKPFQQKLEENQQHTNQEEDEERTIQENNRKQPHLMNLNEDPLLNGKVIYPLTKDQIYVGRKNGNPTPDIILSGLGIQANHAVIENQEGKLTIRPAAPECSDFIYLNGDKLTTQRELNHQDRLIFGTATTFLIMLPSEEEMQQIQQGPEIDWEYAQKELNEKSEKQRKQLEEQQEKEMELEMERKRKQFEEEKKREREEAEAEMHRQREAYERKIKELEEKMKSESEQQKLLIQKAEAERQMIEQMNKLQQEKEQKAQERERQKKQIEDEETVKKYRIKEKNFIENKLSKYLPKVLEVNLIAKELKRNVSLQAKLKYVYADNTELTTNFNEEKAQKGQIQIQVNNREEGQVYLWDLHKFSNRYYIIKELLEKYFETNQIPQLAKQDDPFWDPPEARLIGQGFLKIQALAYLMDNPSELTLVGENFQSGTLMVNLIPTDDTGTRNLSEDIEDGLEPAVEDPAELLGKRFDFRVVIQTAKLPDTLCKDTFVEYSIQVADAKKNQSFRTQTIQGADPKPQYNYDQVHTYQNLSEELLNYLINGTICFKVFGYEDQKGPAKQSQRQTPVEEEIEFAMQKKKNQQQQQVQQQPPQPTPQQPQQAQQPTTQQPQVEQFVPKQNPLQQPGSKRGSIADQPPSARGRISRENEDVLPEQMQFEKQRQAQQTKSKPVSRSSERVPNYAPSGKEKEKKDDKCDSSYHVNVVILNREV